MRSYYLILDGHEPVEATVQEWGAWFETADRIVAQDEVGDSRVSTVFLGMNHAFSDPPLLFETMVFGDTLSDECELAHTWKQGEAQHAQMVARVREAQKKGS